MASYDRENSNRSQFDRGQYGGRQQERDRVQPVNIEAEQAVLGGLLLNPNAWDDVSILITEEDFYKPAHKKIFASLRDLALKSQPIDPITISNALAARAELEGVGGQAYLAEMMNTFPVAGNIEQYAKIVSEKSTVRKVIATGTEMVEKAYTNDFESVEALVDEFEGRIFKLNDEKQLDGPVSAADLVRSGMNKLTELSERDSDVTGVASGFKALDKMTSGFQKGEMTIVAARPSMGKTAFSLNIATHVVLREKKSLLYFSIEMNRDQMMMRVLGSESRVSLNDLRTGKLSDAGWQRIIDKATKIGETNLFIDDASFVTPMTIRSKARKIKARYGLDMIMIDYLQLMKLGHKADNREREVSEISQSLKAIAKDLQVPVIALAQVNRSSEGRGDRRPNVSDLRESGSIEQDADLIMSLYREDYYDRENPDIKGISEVIIGKQRNGPVGTVKLRWESNIGRFSDLEEGAREHPLPPPPQTVPYRRPGPSAGPSA
ncbi:MAG: replicative DNA helicase [Bdellovibrionales bacterium]|jgi:replicative DNA helicase|nr:replicative DNA helicase [Bdellovibrionales bacterium]